METPLEDDFFLYPPDLAYNPYLTCPEDSDTSLNVEYSPKSFPTEISRLQKLVTSGTQGAHLALFSLYLQWYQDKSVLETKEESSISSNDVTNAKLFGIISLLLPDIGDDHSSRAERYFTFCLEKNPKDSEASFLLGCLYEKKKNYSKAIDFYSKAAQAGDTLAMFQVGYIEAFVNQNYEKAEEWLDRSNNMIAWY